VRGPSGVRHGSVMLIGSNSFEWSRSAVATALGRGTSRTLPPFGSAKTYLPRMR
jgi:hypothetical protein